MSTEFKWPNQKKRAANEAPDLYRFRSALNVLEAVEPLSGGRVLDIGGRLNSDREPIVDGMNLEELVVVNTESPLGDHKLDLVKFFQQDARELAFPDGYFDAIMGTAVLEHFLDLPIVFSELSRVTKENGAIYLTGDPIWTCSRGHHVWLRTERRYYKFTDSSCPIEPFEHLLLSNEQLVTNLIERRICRVDAEAIGKQVFESDVLNRLSDRQIEEYAYRAPFEIIAVRKLHGKDEVPRSVALDAAKNDYDPTVNQIRLLARAAG